MTNSKGKLGSVPDQPYDDLVTALHDHGIIPKEDLDAWRSMVGLRNSFSHRTSTAILERHKAIAQPSYIAELLNRLFN